MLKLYKCLFLLFFCGATFCLGIESDDETDWEALSDEIYSLLNDWGNELVNDKENSLIIAHENNVNTCSVANLNYSLENISSNIRLITETYNSEIFRRIREIFDGEKCFIESCSDEEIQEILCVIKRKKYNKVLRASKNYLLNMRTREQFEVQLPAKNLLSNLPEKLEPKLRQKDSLAVRRIKEISIIFEVPSDQGPGRWY